MVHGLLSSPPFPPLSSSIIVIIILIPILISLIPLSFPESKPAFPSIVIRHFNFIFLPTHPDFQVYPQTPHPLTFPLLSHAHFSCNVYHARHYQGKDQ